MTRSKAASTACPGIKHMPRHFLHCPDICCRTEDHCPGCDTTLRERLEALITDHRHCEPMECDVFDDLRALLADTPHGTGGDRLTEDQRDLVEKRRTRRGGLPYDGDNYEEELIAVIDRLAPRPEVPRG